MINVCNNLSNVDIIKAKLKGEFNGNFFIKKTRNYDDSLSTAEKIRAELYGAEGGFGNVDKVYAKIYRDYNGHGIAVPHYSVKDPDKEITRRDPSALDIAFDEVYKENIGEYRRKKHLSENEEFKTKIKEALYWRFEEDESLDSYKLWDIDTEEGNKLDEYLIKRIDRKCLNDFKKRRRMTRKARMYKWNYFVTITYDSKKFVFEQDYVDYVRKFMSNMSTRHNWCYMGVFERGERNERLHYHALVYIPEGGMIGALEMTDCYDYKTGKRKQGLQNTHLAETCGRNEFDPVPELGNHLKDIVDYIKKYLQKSGEKIRYSRGCPEEVEIIINPEDIYCQMQNEYNERYILWDNIILKLKEQNRYNKRIKGEFADLFRVESASLAA